MFFPALANKTNLGHLLRSLTRCFLVTLFLCLSNAPGFAQLIKEFGVKAGVSVSAFDSRFRSHDGAPEFNWEAKSDVGYAIEVWADILQKTHWDYAVAVSFDQRRGMFNTPAPGVFSDSKHTFQYAGIINSLRGKIHVTPRLNLFGIGGLRIDQLLSHNQTNPAPFDFSYLELKKIRLGFKAGIGVNYKISESGSLGFEATRNINITKAIKDDNSAADRLPGFLFELNDRTYFFLIQYSRSF